MPKGDLFVESKHADVTLQRGEDFSQWWFDTPKKGKCLNVEYCFANWPAGGIAISSNTRARRLISKCKNQMGFEETRSF